MSEDCLKKPLVESESLRCVRGVLLIVPVGLLVGTLLGLISDFGVRFTVENIRANPETFADQYAGPLVYSGWTALVCLIAVIVNVGIQLRRRKKG